ncbi:MAG: YfhO family protein [Candidatus Omnitrophica bacterium]|nr:YfhO family protein [Candidatus Omnitrophota bacterium]
MPKFKNIFIVSGIVVFFILFFAPLLITRTRMFSHDTIWFYGVFHYFADQLLQGVFPYWDPYDYCGQPFYTNLSIMHLTNPFTVGIIMLNKVMRLSLLTLYHWHFMLEIAFSGIGVYFFSRTVNKHRFTHFFMMFVFLFSSFTFICLRQNGFLYAFLYLPWVLFFLIRILDNFTLFNMAGLALFLGLAMGGYQGLFVVVFFAVFVISLLVTMRQTVARAIRPANIPLLILGAVIVVVLSGPLLAVFADKADFVPMARERMSGCVPAEWEDFRGLVDRALAVHGYFDGTRALSEGFLHIGFIPLIFAAVGLLLVRDRFKVNFLATLVFVGLIMVGDKCFVQKIVNIVFPPFQFTRHMQLFAGFFLFNLIYFSGKGCEWFIGAMRSPVREKIFVTAAGCLVFADLITYGIPALGYVTLDRTPMQFSEYPTRVVFADRRERRVVKSEETRYFKPALYKVHTAYNAATVPRQFSDRELIHDLYRLVEGCSDTEKRFSFYEEARQLTVRDFVAYGIGHFTSWGKNDRLAFLDILNVILVDCMRQNDFYAFFGDSLKQGVYARTAVYAGYRELGAGSPDWSFRQQAGAAIIKLLDLSSRADPAANTAVFNFLGKKYNLDRRLAIHKQFFKTMPLQRYLEFIWNTNHVEEFTLLLKKDYEELLTLTGRPNDGAVHEGTVERIERSMGIRDTIIQFYSSADGALSGRIGVPYRVTVYTSNVLELTADTPRDCCLYVSDGYDKYWTAFIDGKKAAVEKANGAFKLVRMPAGKHTVRFVYSPAPFKIALGIYYVLIGIVLIYFISLIGRMRSGKSFQTA